MTISPFGWINNSAPYLDAANLESMLGDAGAYTDAETVRAETAEATLTAASLSFSHVVRLSGAASLTPGTFFLDATAGGFAVTLPNATAFPAFVTLKATTATANVVSINTVAGQTVESTYASGQLTLGSAASSAPWNAVTVASDGSNWWLL